MSELREHAHKYAAGFGWHVFPCLGKRPLTCHGLLDASTDHKAISEWWRTWPHANIGVRTGAPSRIVVLDIDGDDGHESIRQLEARHEQLPRTASVKTPRGGSHLYFRHPGGSVANSAGALGVALDVRGDGGYVIAPPSTGPNGGAYQADEQAPIAPLPAWLQRLIAAPTDALRLRTPVAEWIRMVRDGLAEGERNMGLTRLVGHLLAKDVDERLVLELAHLINTRCSPSLNTDEVDRIVSSIAGRELRKRTGRAHERQR